MFPNVLRGDALRMNFDFNFRIQRLKRPFAGLNLEKSYVTRPVKDLALEIVQFHPVRVGQPDRSNTRGRQVKRCGRSQATCPHDKNLGLRQFLWPFPPTPGRMICRE